MVVVTEVWATSMPLRPPEPTSPLFAPVESARPRRKSLLASVTVFCTVAVPVGSDGRASVPVGGVSPKTVSKVVPVVPCPTSFSIAFRVIPAA